MCVRICTCIYSCISSWFIFVVVFVVVALLYICADICDRHVHMYTYICIQKACMSGLVFDVGMCRLSGSTRPKTAVRTLTSFPASCHSNCVQHIVDAKIFQTRTSSSPKPKKGRPAQSSYNYVPTEPHIALHKGHICICIYIYTHIYPLQLCSKLLGVYYYIPRAYYCSQV